MTDAGSDLLAGIGAVLRQLREEAGLTQREASRLYQGSQATISYTENGKVDMVLSTLVRLANIYGHEVVVTFEPAKDEFDLAFDEAMAEVMAGITHP